MGGKLYTLLLRRNNGNLLCDATAGRCAGCDSLGVAARLSRRLPALFVDVNTGLLLDNGGTGGAVNFVGSATDGDRFRIDPCAGTG